MKARLGVVLAVVALLAVALVPNVARADSDAHCWADPTNAVIGDTITVSCTGFSPNTYITSYFVTPEGSAIVFRDLSHKTNERGEVTLPFNTDFGDATVALGAYTVVFDEKGLSNTILKHGEAHFTVKGKAEGVSGATMVASADKITKGQSVTIYGAGFAPNEVVSLWLEYPNASCPLATYHDYFYNDYTDEDLGTESIGDVKADAYGEVTFSLSPYLQDCEGKYRIVGRGNSSGWGAEVWVTLTGQPVETNAWLTASPERAAALFDWVYFSGTGFGANQAISCWLTAPKGQVTVVDQLWQAPVKSDASGAFTFPIYTGSYFPGFAVASEGALGEYAMSCRDSAGNTGIARFTVTGGMIDP